MSHAFRQSGQQRSRLPSPGGCSSIHLRLQLLHVLSPFFQVSREEQFKHRRPRFVPTATDVEKTLAHVWQEKKPVCCRRLCWRFCWRTSSWQARHTTPQAGIVTISGSKSGWALVSPQRVHTISARWICTHFKQRRKESAFCCSSCARGKASAILLVSQPLQRCFRSPTPWCFKFGAPWCFKLVCALVPQIGPRPGPSNSPAPWS